MNTKHTKFLFDKFIRNSLANAVHEYSFDFPEYCFISNKVFLHWEIPSKAKNIFVQLDFIRGNKMEREIGRDLIIKIKTISPDVGIDTTISLFEETNKCFLINFNDMDSLFTTNEYKNALIGLHEICERTHKGKDYPELELDDIVTPIGNSIVGFLEFIVNYS